MVLAYFVFPGLFFLISAYLLRRDPMLAVVLLLGLRLFLGIALFKTIPAIGFAAGTFINIAILMLFLWSAVRFPRMLLRRHTIVMSATIALFLAYLIGVASVRGDDPLAYLHYVRNFFFNFLLLWVALSVPGRRPRPARHYLGIAVTLALIQIGLGFAQYADRGVSDFFKVVQYERLGVEQLALQEVFEQQKVVTGTLRSMQNVSSFVMMTLVFLLSLRLAARTTPRGFALFLLSGASIGLMLVAGVRAPMVGLVIGVALVSWQRSRMATAATVGAMVLFIPLVTTTFSAEIDYATTAEASADVERPMQRIIGALAVFDVARFRDTTLRRTVFLSEGLQQDIIFGSGPGIIFTDYSVTDAFLIILVIEFGLVGLFLLVLPYLYIVWLLRAEAGRKIAYVGGALLLVMLSQSIVNEGLWADFANAHFMFLILILFRLGEEGRASLEGLAAGTFEPGPSTPGEDRLDLVPG